MKNKILLALISSILSASASWACIPSVTKEVNYVFKSVVSDYKIRIGANESVRATFALPGLKVRSIETVNLPDTLSEDLFSVANVKTKNGSKIYSYTVWGIGTVDLKINLQDGNQLVQRIEVSMDPRPRCLPPR